ncbi:MAG: helix-turn-helix transcriptional regulator, partial [Lachnospiraceae bacterium]|nr:helix-turn-helix transcriptional regulator [Lachnospiraceae bacterium]
MANGKEAEERKKEILDAAEELFIARGYDETSTSDILEKVGIARGTLYYHFKSKEEILDALIDRIMQEAARRMNAALSGKEDVLHKVILF